MSWKLRKEYNGSVKDWLKPAFISKKCNREMQRKGHCIEIATSYSEAQGEDQALRNWSLHDHFPQPKSDEQDVWNQPSRKTLLKPLSFLFLLKVFDLQT